MMKSLRNVRFAALLILLLGATFALETAAIVGAPATPVSVAGVARRTTRRTVAVASTEAAAASAASASAASAQASAAAASASAAQASAAQAAAAAPAPSGAPPAGTVVTALPGGCTQVQVNGVAYSNCGGVYYRAAFQGENLVYVVQQP
jgi:hypothetical protein